jgi:hypothetical protein
MAPAPTTAIFILELNPLCGSNETDITAAECREFGFPGLTLVRVKLAEVTGNDPLPSFDLALLAS